MKIPQGIEIKLIKGTELYVKGPQGVKKAQVSGVREKGGELEAEDQVTRGIIKKMIQGVKTGYKQKIKIQGVGYRAEVQGREIEMHLGYKEPKRVRIPAGVEMTVMGNGTIIEGRSTSWSELRQSLSQIVELRSAEKDRYKGKGVVKWK